MNELLQNPVIQTALITAIVACLNALVNWLKKKFPTQAAQVESNWCYLQPVVEAAMAQASEKNPGGTAQSILLKGLADFAESYRKLEGKEPTTAEINAAQTEISAAISRVTGG